jgi:hypothetical protein
MRKQYYFRPSPVGLLAWDVDRLVELSRNFIVRAVPLEEIQELDDALFGADEAPTWRSFAAHCRLVQETELLKRTDDLLNSLRLRHTLLFDATAPSLGRQDDLQLRCKLKR